VTCGLSVPVYEQPGLREALDGVLRPGGLALTDEMVAAAGLPAGARVLDVGCGVGTTVAHLRRGHGLDAVGVDASELLLDAGHAQAAALPLIQAWGEQLPMAGGGFDAVLAECSLSLMPDMDGALAEFRRVLKPGGRLLWADIYVRNAGAQAPDRPAKPASCLQGALTRAQIEERLAAHDLVAGTWQDCPDAVKVFAARLILAGISPAQFWGSACEDAMGAATRLRPGYFWLVAKTGEIE
jgi:arsenite methyltransferase